MRRSPSSLVLLLCTAGLFVGSSLCGCLSLSFGGKHEHLEPSPASTATLLHNAATTQKLEAMEARLQALEQRCGDCPANVEPTPNAPESPILTVPLP